MLNGGYKSYNQNSCILGNLLELLNKTVLINKINANLINELDRENNKIYAVLINISYIKNGIVSGISPMKSLIITGKSNVYLIADNILNGLNKVNNEYNLDSDECIVKVYWREWLPNSEYAKLVEPIKRNDIIDEVLREEANLKLDTQSKLDKILRFMCIDEIQNYLNDFPSFNSITELEPYSFSNDMELMRLIQELQEENDNIKISVYKHNRMILIIINYIMYLN